MPLLCKSNLSFYWLGFMLADAHFSKLNRIKITLSLKDLSHLEKIKQFLPGKISVQTNRKYPTCSWCVMDSRSVKELKERYSISERKTFVEPNLSSLNVEQMFCLIVGFIDGDGSITNQHGRTDCFLRIKVHANWEKTLNLFADIIASIFSEFTRPKVLINSKGYCEFRISNNEVLRRMRKMALSLELPVMERKWQKIDLEASHKYGIAASKRDLVFKLRTNGLKLREIKELVSLSESRICMILNKPIDKIKTGIL